jgi:transcriptional regulator with XRE-family HTH domain
LVLLIEPGLSFRPGFSLLPCLSLPLAATSPVFRVLGFPSTLWSNARILPQGNPFHRDLKLENYLRAYRKRSGLTQREVASLLGCRNGAQVSRYEKRKRVPPLRTALACEAVFGIPVADLFAGTRQAVGKEIGRRLLGLRSRLQTQNTEDRSKSEARQTTRKLEWLAGRLGLENPTI